MSSIRSTPAFGNSRRALAGMVLGGLAAGVLDIVYAFIASALRGGTPLKVLQSVASGLLGRSAFEGGIGTAIIGLICHLVIMIGAAAVYFAAGRYIAMLRERPIVAGAIFGILVYLFMNFVVLPLSAIPFRITYSALVLAKGFVSHALLVGIPIALFIRYFSTSRPAQAS
jgi:hypothetical protein